MEITPKLVADLRAETGVGMMDCKKALVEAGGDFEEAKQDPAQEGPRGRGAQGGPRDARRASWSRA